MPSESERSSQCESKTFLCVACVYVDRVGLIGEEPSHVQPYNFTHGRTRRLAIKPERSCANRPPTLQRPSCFARQAKSLCRNEMRMPGASSAAASCTCEVFCMLGRNPVRKHSSGVARSGSSCFACGRKPVRKHATSSPRRSRTRGASRRGSSIRCGCSGVLKPQSSSSLAPMTATSR